MKKIAAGLVLLCLVGWIGYLAFKDYQARAEESLAGGIGPGGMNEAMRGILVDTQVVRAGTLKDRVLLIGSLRPNAEVEVMSKIAGRIEEVLVDVGDSVRKGHLISRVEDREIQQQVEQAEASMAVARASIRQREAELANYSRQVERFEELYEQQLLSRQDLEDALTRKQTSEAQLELSKAQLRQTEAAINQFRINLDNTRSYAPMDGIVSRRYLHPGALVSLNTPIVSIVDLKQMRTIVNVVGKDIVRVTRGSAADVVVDAFPERTFRGRVERVSPVLNPATRTGEVEIYVSNENLDLRAEMFARVSLDLGLQRRGLLVPREAVVYRGDQTGVFVLDENVARFRPVEPGISTQDELEVLAGLKEGEKVVTMGASLLKDGDRVRLRTD